MRGQVAKHGSHRNRTHHPNQRGEEASGGNAMLRECTRATDIPQRQRHHRQKTATSSVVAIAIISPAQRNCVFCSACCCRTLKLCWFPRTVNKHRGPKSYFRFPGAIGVVCCCCVVVLSLSWLPLPLLLLLLLLPLLLLLLWCCGCGCCGCCCCSCLLFVFDCLLWILLLLLVLL